MKIVLISGSYPPQVCGVGDYTRNLFDASGEGNWVLYTSNDWRLRSLRKHIRSVSDLRPDAVVLQYPTQGYGWSIVPHLIGIYYSCSPRVKFTLALHEFSQMSLKARMALWALLACVQSVIFTSRYEASFGVKTLSRLRNRHAVIPIKYNLEPVSKIRSFAERVRDVCYFGQIRPNKGVEQFVHDCKDLMKRQAGLSIYIVGQIPEGYESYLQSVQRLIEGTSIQIVANLESAKATDFLNECKVAYLPFPDGISERRGSFLAAISNGLAVVSCAGEFVSSELRCAFHDADRDPSAAILRLLHSTPEQYAEIQERGFEYLKKNVPESWAQISNLYEDFIARSS